MTKQDNCPPLRLADDNSVKFRSPREIYPDLLRILASFAVVVLHSAAVGFYGRFAPDTTQFQACNFYNSIVRFCVPVFVMISGMFLLDEHKEYPVRKLYQTKILRIAIAYFGWSTFYALITQFHMHFSMSIRELVWEIIKGPYHLWFLLMITGLYIMTPILRWIARNDGVCVYFIILGIITVFCLPLFAGVPGIGPILESILERMEVKVAAGFSTYYLLGYYLSKHRISSRSLRSCIYGMGMLAVIGTILYNGLYSVHKGTAGGWVYGNFMPNTFLASVALFVFCQSHFPKARFSPGQYAIISLLAKMTFGIYLVHVFILDHLRCIGLPNFFIHPLFSIPITSCLTWILSFCFVYVMQKIPILNRYAI